MAIETQSLSEAELNAPDIGDDGNLDVETFLLPDASGIDDPYLKEVWELARQQLEDGDLEEDEEPIKEQRSGKQQKYAHAGKHAPKGYTAAHPLKIAGNEYYGGQFIPGNVLDEATEEELAQSEKEGPGAEEDDDDE